MAYEEPNPNIVEIRLNFHQNDNDLHVDFPFDTEKDDLESVVNDLITTLGCEPEEKSKIKQLISEQINKAFANDEDSSTENMSGNDYNQNSPTESPQNSVSNLNVRSNQGAGTPQIDTDDDDDDEFLNYPEYIQLLQKQEKELQELRAKHTSEQLALAQKLTRGTIDEDLLIF